MFPNILNPPYAGTYTFSIRAYDSNNVAILRYRFPIVVQPATLAAPIFMFNSVLDNPTTLYPNTNQYYNVNWTIKNPLPAQTSYIQIIFDSNFVLETTYCEVVSTVSAFYGT